ncbi:hypothetical protein NM688_g5637 [Phlebia brevispora]|uniref:Uncharacterized protein n=1 Tax=Phlebia brevispora TaxID=194682 RepID=A0ACC1SSB7_9APHY|nr:hypothetical protein NM688_g5637 [Phlebia brevispora]
MSTHILYDKSVDRDGMPCGFCLSTGNACAIYVTKSRGKHGGYNIDMNKSRCPNKFKFALSHFSTPSTRRFCTNVPIVCPRCSKGSPAVWKYNLERHLCKVHRVGDIMQYEDLWGVSHDELAGMKKRYENPPRVRVGKRKRIELKKSKVIISAAHQCTIALRSFSSETDLGTADTLTHVRGSAAEPSPTRNLDLDQVLNTNLNPADETVESVPPHTGGTIDSEGEATETEPSDDETECSDVPSEDESTLDHCLKGADFDARTSSSESKACICGRPEYSEMVRCDKPGCGQWFHYDCVNIQGPPSGDWFCDEDCRANAGIEVRKPKKRARRDN